MLVLQLCRMILAERANHEQVQTDIQSVVTCCGVAVRKVSHTHYFKLLPPCLAHLLSSRCNYAQVPAALFV